MKRLAFHLGIGLASILTLASSVLVSAQAEVDEGVKIDQIRLVNDQQFVRLHNGGSEQVDLANYELFYISTSGTNKMFVFEELILEPGDIYIMSEGTMTMCYPAYVDNVSLNFSAGSSASSGAQLQLWRYADDTKTMKIQADGVSWRNKVPVTSDIAKLPSGADGIFFRRLPEDSETDWQAVAPMPDSECELVGFSDASPPPANEEFSFLSGSMPPVKYSRAVGGGGVAKVVNRNPGKAAPIINEVLPNPASPQTDAENEFIELYNPNNSSFDLTDFKLAFGSTNPRKFTFPEGTVLKPKEFRAFTSGDTSISLSNSQAQVWLLDPNEKVIGQTKPYSKAKDGQAWALDKGKWVWTLQTTPNAINTISVAIETSTNKGKTAATTLGISTTTSASAGEPSTNTSANGEVGTNEPSALHPGVLAIVGAAAVAYSLYEYRQDLSNQIFRARRHLRRRQTLRKQA